MKIAVVAPSPVPFSFGGSERALAGLVQAFNEATAHAAELLKLPVHEASLVGLMEGYEAFARLDVSHFDMVVTTKYPAWMVQHDHHVVYLFHTLRGLYDTYHHFGLPEVVDHHARDLHRLQGELRRPPTRAALDEVFGLWHEVLAGRGHADPALSFPGPLARELVRWLDGVGLHPSQVRRHLSLSSTVARRPGYLPEGVVAEVVHLPSSLGGLRPGPFDSFFTASRLDGPKRIGLLVEAMAHVPIGVDLRIAGTGPLLERLEAMAAGDGRIRVLGHLSDAALADEYARALAVPYVPLDEDLGLVAIEAMSSSKAVVTCTDSGGPTELVQHGRTGLVVAPTPRAIGSALTSLATDRERAARMGKAAGLRATRIGWPQVVRALLGESPTARAPVPSRLGRPRLVMTSTFAVDPPMGGGQLRCSYLGRAFCERFDVHIVSLGAHGRAPTTSTLAPGLSEIVIPKSADHETAELALSRPVEVPITDIVAGTLIHRTPAYLDALREALQGAAGVVLAHPFLHPAVEATGVGCPIVYDAHNVEVLLKDAVLPRNPAGDLLRRSVRETEAAAVHAAVLVSATSEEEADALVSIYGVPRDRVVVVPNGADVMGTPFVTGDQRAEQRERWLDRFSSGGRRRRPAHLALFVGSWHPPNIEAAERILELAAVMSDTCFVLAGSHCLAFRTTPLPPNVVLAGMVTDLARRALLSSAEVALNPMRSGAGTNLKLFEYLAAGVPVVSTTLGARGLAEPERYVRLCDEDRLDRAIRAAYSDPDVTARAVAGRALVEAQYDWAVIGRRLASRLEEVLVHGRRSASTREQTPVL